MPSEEEQREKEVEEEEAQFAGTSETANMFKSTILTSVFMVSPVVVFFLVVMFGPAFGFSKGEQILGGIIAMIAGFFVIMFYYYSNATGLFGKTALSTCHWVTPAETISGTPVIDKLIYLGIGKGGLHYTDILFEGEDFPEMLLLSEGHPNEMMIPSSDWILYKGLIYPASVAIIDTVELMRINLGLGSSLPLIVAKVQASAYHARVVQDAAARFAFKRDHNPNKSEVREALDMLGAFRALIYKERWQQAEGQLAVYKHTSKDFKRRLSQSTAELEDLAAKSREETKAGFLEKLKLHPWMKKVLLILIVASIITAIIVIIAVLKGSSPTPVKTLQVIKMAGLI